jgi:nucleoside 2-deoxyribosyltransferase
VKKLYVIGSMRNPAVPRVAKLLREAGYEVFDDWYSPGAQADEKWQEYERDRGRSYKEALNGHHARHVFELDHRHLKEADGAVLVMPAGRSGHVELGWILGQGKPAWVLFDEEPERYDIMYRFLYEAGGDVCFSDDELLEKLHDHR